MNKNEENQKYTPIKSYILFMLMIIAVILISLYIYKWYQIKRDENFTKNYLVESNLVVNKINSTNELENVLTENSSKLLLYITYRNSSKIYNLEKKYDSIFKKYDLNDIFYLFDITEIKNSKNNYKNYINNYLDIDVSGYPVIIYYQDGEINSYSRIKSYKDLEKFLNKIKADKNSL